MGLYSYKCQTCGEVKEDLRKPEDREIPAKCDKCYEETTTVPPIPLAGLMIFQPVQKTSFRMQGFEKNG